MNTLFLFIAKLNNVNLTTSLQRREGILFSHFISIIENKIIGVVERRAREKKTLLIASRTEN